MEKNATNVDYSEINKFSEQAQSWWDLDGVFKPLHQINPLRLAFIQKHVDLAGKKVCDVGCGGGILSEALAAAGAEVTGIDLAEKSLSVARLHLYESGLQVNYQAIAVEDLAKEMPESYDVITCMEMLEHVPDPASIIKACAALCKPNGTLFFSTLNRNPKAYLFAILGAEYILNLIPRGTHDYQRFIKPSELNRMAQNNGLYTTDLASFSYHPLRKTYHASQNTDVNYMVSCEKMGVNQ